MGAGASSGAGGGGATYAGSGGGTAVTTPTGVPQVVQNRAPETDAPQVAQ
jgi:hypothetical protein